MAKEKFWLVWNGNRKNFPPKFNHGTLAEACQEADRLAAELGGRFYVLEAIGYSQAKVTISESEFVQTV